MFFGFRKYRLFITFDFVEATGDWQETKIEVKDWKRNLLQPATFIKSFSTENEKAVNQSLLKVDIYFPYEEISKKILISHKLVIRPESECQD